MYLIDGLRKTINKDHPANELKERDWYCPKCDKTIQGLSNELIYLGEYDYVFHIEDINTNEITQVFKLVAKDKINVTGQVPYPKIDKLDKLIKNTSIKGDSERENVLNRDNHQCQLCGWSDGRSLMVHHIIPRSSPFLDKEYIKSPINLITLCANCHRAAHHIMRWGTDEERSEMNSYLIRLNGGNPSRVGVDLHICDSERSKWNKMMIK